MIIIEQKESCTAKHLFWKVIPHQLREQRLSLHSQEWRRSCRGLRLRKIGWLNKVLDCSFPFGLYTTRLLRRVRHQVLPCSTCECVWKCTHATFCAWITFLLNQLLTSYYQPLITYSSRATTHREIPLQRLLLPSPRHRHLLLHHNSSQVVRAFAAGNWVMAVIECYWWLIMVYNS